VGPGCLLGVGVDCSGEQVIPGGQVGGPPIAITPGPPDVIIRPLPLPTGPSWLDTGFETIGTPTVPRVPGFPFAPRPAPLPRSPVRPRPRPIFTPPPATMPEVTITAPRGAADVPFFTFVASAVAPFGILGGKPSPAPRTKPRPPPRRTKPSPKTRPRRPVKPPAKPAFKPPPILTPAPGEAPEKLLGRLARLLGLTSPFAEAAQLLLYSPDAGFPSEADMLLPYLVPPPYEQPKPPPAPTPAPGPTPDAGTVVIPGVRPGGATSPLGDITLQPVPTPGPRPYAPPVVGPEPLAPPAPKPPPEPLPQTGVMPPPAPPKKPPKIVPPPPPQLSTIPEPQPQPEPDPCKKQKQKDKKKRKERETCHSGYYYERKKGLSKHPKRTITCR
jgi:hypothetical protein